MNYTFHTDPWPHQLKGLEYFMAHDSGALYTDMGSGKSKILIDTAVNRGFRSILIVAPIRVCPSWVEQFKTHAPKKFKLLDLTKYDGTKLKLDTLKNVIAKCKSRNHKLVIMVNYESVWRKGLKEFLLKQKLDAVICDEAHKIKSPSSKCSGMLTLLGRRTQHRYLITGTPMSQSPLDVYAQYRFLDSSIFGTNYANFKELYSNWIPIPGGFPILDKKNPYKNLDKFRERMFSVAFYINDLQQDLPDTVDVYVPFYMSPKAQKAYNGLLEEGALEFSSGYVTTKNILGVIQKEQQLTSGYLTIESEDGSKKLVQGDLSRVETFKELISDIPCIEPVVVFCRYTQDIKNVRSALKDMKIPSSELSGKLNSMADWDKGKTRVLVIQIQAGAEGLNNLVKSRYCVYYSMHPSLALWKQSRKRQHRPGQKHKVTYYTIIAKKNSGKTIDERIIEALRRNEDLVDSIMNDLI